MPTSLAWIHDYTLNFHHTKQMLHLHNYCLNIILSAVATYTWLLYSVLEVELIIIVWYIYISQFMNYAVAFVGNFMQ